MFRIIFLLVIGYFIYQLFLGVESGCDKYASRYSCDYVENKALYDVYYWKNVSRSNPSDEIYIGSVTGLSSCEASAISFGRSIGERWNNRSYICVLKKDGRSMEKHRL